MISIMTTVLFKSKSITKLSIDSRKQNFLKKKKNRFVYPKNL